MSNRISLTAIGFLVMAFIIVGLVGIFASFAAPLPLQRALSHETAWDAALEATRGPNPTEAIARLAPSLGDSAKALLAGDPASLPARIQAERIAARALFEAEAEAVGFRLRLLIGLVTLASAAFGVAMAGIRGAR